MLGLIRKIKSPSDRTDRDALLSQQMSLQPIAWRVRLQFIIGHQLAPPGGDSHRHDQQTVEDHQQRQRHERKQRLVGVLVADLVGGGFPE